MKAAPIKSLTISASTETPTYGEKFTLTAMAVRPDGQTGTFTYKWYMNGQEYLAIAGSDDAVSALTFPDEITGETLNVGNYPFTCIAICNGCSVTSNEVEVSVTKKVLTASIVAESDATIMP